MGISRARKGGGVMDQTQTVSSGLLSAKGALVPLVGVSVRAEVRDYVCRVVLSQRFINRETQPIEAVYKFPLDEGSAVCGFEVEIDGRLITGHVEERDKAFETYEEALSAGIWRIPRGRGAHGRLHRQCRQPAARQGGHPETHHSLGAPARRRRHPLHASHHDRTTLRPGGRSKRRGRNRGRAGQPALRPPGAVRTHPRGGRSDDRASALGRVALAPDQRDDRGRPRHGPSRRARSGARPRRRAERSPGRDAPAARRRRARARWPRLRARVISPEAVVRVGVRPKSSFWSTGPARCKAIRSPRRRTPSSSHSAACAPAAASTSSASARPSDSLFPESRVYDDASLAEATEHVARLDADLGGTELLPALAARPRGRAHSRALPRQLVRPDRRRGHQHGRGA